MKNKNFRISCVGIDHNGLTSRCIFYIYGVAGIDEAMKQLMEDKSRKNMMTRHGIDWKEAKYRAIQVRKDGTYHLFRKDGTIAEANIERELIIFLEEEAEMEELRIREHVFNYEAG